MDKNNCFHLGYIAKTIGNSGELSIVLNADDLPEIEHINSILIDINGILTPFFIESILMKGKQNEAHLQLEDLQSTEQAKEFVGKEIYLPLNMLPPRSGKSFYSHEIIGFRAKDKNHGDIGIIKAVMERPQQHVIEIEKDGKEILIPLVDDFIVDIDREKRMMVFDTPEGLIDLYLADS